MAAPSFWSRLVLGEDITNAAVLKIEALDSDFFKKVKDIASFHQDLASLVA
jgi:hypothetical protein